MRPLRIRNPIQLAGAHLHCPARLPLLELGECFQSCIQQQHALKHAPLRIKLAERVPVNPQRAGVIFKAVLILISQSTPRLVSKSTVIVSCVLIEERRAHDPDLIKYKNGPWPPPLPTLRAHQGLLSMAESDARLICPEAKGNTWSLFVADAKWDFFHGQGSSVSCGD